MNPNVQIPADRILDPMLAELVSKLSMEKPNWFFRQAKNETGYSHAMRMGERAPEGKRYIRELGVFQDNRLAGSIWVEQDRKSTRLNSSHTDISRMPSSA